MGDEDLRTLVTKMSRREGMPVVTDPGIHRSGRVFAGTFDLAFPQPFLPDTPQRIATDTSQKLPIRFGVDIQHHITRGTAGELVLMPLVFAGWLRYLKGIDDQGNPFSCSPDPFWKTSAHCQMWTLEQKPPKKALENF